MGHQSQGSPHKNVPSLCRYLDLTNPKLTLIVGDIRDKEQCHLAMEDVSYVFHLAGGDVAAGAKVTRGAVPAPLMHVAAYVFCVGGRSAAVPPE